MTDADHGRPLPQTAEQWRLLQTQKLLELSWIWPTGARRRGPASPALKGYGSMMLS